MSYGTGDPAESGNAAYVVDVVAWVRALLNQRLQAADPAGLAGPADDTRARPRPGWGGEPNRAVPDDTGPPADSPPPVSDVDRLAAALAAAEAADPAPDLVGLSRRFGLSPFERSVLMLCVAVELDPSLRRLCARLHGQDQMSYPTFALALSVLPDPEWAALSPDAPLRAGLLVDVERSSDVSLVTAQLRTDERVVNAVRGLNHIDVRLRALVTPIAASDADALPASQQRAVDAIASRWTAEQPGGGTQTGQAQRSRMSGRRLEPLVAQPPVAQLVGSPRGTAELFAGAVSDRFGLACHRMSSASVPSDDVQLDHLARLWRREAGLAPVALLVDAADGSGELAARFALRVDMACLVHATQALPELAGRGVLVDVAPPTTAERHAAWLAGLPADQATRADALAAQFALDTASIARIAANADRADPWAQCRAEARPRLDGLAERIVPTATWDDLVLDEPRLQMLHAICDQVRNRWQVYHEWDVAEPAGRGQGVTALLSGASGVGKTSAAHVLAADLDLDLYQTDLSGIVSKYIGETEKNLRRLFDAAEAGGAVLFIDEADALFGKRSEVKDSHDRFANVQIDYLLQRMESYRGLAILATNMRSALDTAFLRRLRFIVEFPFPTVAQRAAIWRAHLPASIPGAEGLDIDRLAELGLNGGMIRNVALNAAFLAAAADPPEVTMPLVLRAARDEFTKLQLPVPERQLAYDLVSS
jgi:ATPase family associated with various cellular activities (AAA)